MIDQPNITITGAREHNLKSINVSLPRNQIIISADAISPNDNANYINAGLKLQLLDGLISLYAGANSLFLDNAESEFSIGGGVTIPQILNNSLSVHFTHEQMKFLGNSQQLSISFNY